MARAEPALLADAPPRPGANERVAMLIVCPSCASEYRIDPARLGASGQRVRCASCRDTWFVLPPSPTAVTVDASLPAGSTGQDFRIEAPAAERRRTPLRVAPRRPSRSLGAGRLLVAAAAVTVLLIPPALAFRERVVAAVPRSAALFAAVRLPVNLAGVALSDVSAARTEDGDARVLVIEGRIANAAGRTTAIPRLDLSIEGGAGEQLYRWTAKPPRPELASGETAPFRLRLASPPPEGRRVIVSFERPGPSAAIAMR